MSYIFAIYFSHINSGTNNKNMCRRVTEKTFKIRRSVLRFRRSVTYLMRRAWSRLLYIHVLKSFQVFDKQFNRHLHGKQHGRRISIDIGRQDHKKRRAKTDKKRLQVYSVHTAQLQIGSVQTKQKSHTQHTSSKF